MQPETGTIQLWINGEVRTVQAGLSVADLLAELGVRAEGVAVERNRLVVRRHDHATCALQAQDRIEIVQFVGGG